MQIIPLVIVGFFFVGLGFGVLGLEFGVWSLEFGVWSLEFGVWSLEFGVWSFQVAGFGFLSTFLLNRDARRYKEIHGGVCVVGCWFSIQFLKVKISIFSFKNHFLKQTEINSV